MRTSENITELAKALVGFHSEVGKIKKEDRNPFFKSTYAGLPSILDAVSEPLNNNGLVIVQAPNESGLTTRLLHSSGQWMESTYTMPVAKQNDPQALGSAITYARRYAIGAILSLNIDEDDDGNYTTHGSSKPQKQAPKPSREPEAEPATAKQQEQILKLLNHPLIQKEEKSKMLLNINKLDKERADLSINKLKKTIQEREEAELSAEHEKKVA